MSAPQRKLWFPAKRYGWGWGLPICWQGWVFLLSWIAALITGVWLIHPHRHLAGFVLFEGLMILVLILVCLRKGEKPRWR